MAWHKSSLVAISAGSLLCGIFALFMPTKPALAWFKVCNQSTRQNVSVAFAYLDTDASVPDIFGNREPALRRGWNSQGWWNLQSGECTTVFWHQLNHRNSFWYVYAESSDGGVWSGNNYFCVVPGDEFHLGNANARCGGRGKRYGFSEVNTGNAKDYTFNLTE